MDVAVSGAVDEGSSLPWLDDLSVEQLINRMGEADARIDEEMIVRAGCLDRLQTKLNGRYVIARKVASV